MRTIQSTTSVSIRVKAHDVLNNRFVPIRTVTRALTELEKRSAEYARITEKFYNTCKAGRCNVVNCYGVKWIDIQNPMKEGLSAIDLKIEVEK